MKQDRFLAGILIFIGILVLAALGLFFVRSRAPAYRPDDTPQGVVYDYAVALELKDYPRAYGYIAKRDAQPSFDAFQQAFLDRQLDPINMGLQIGAVQILSDGKLAWVTVTVQNAGSGLFNSSYANVDKAILVQQGGAWKIAYLPYPYWGLNWYTPTPQPVKTP